MDIEEIKRYVELGQWRSVHVDIKLMQQYPGIVRSVVFYRENRVCIEFTTHGSDEGGFNYCCNFDSLEEAVASIEDYLDMPIRGWTNYNKMGQYPDLPADTDFQQGCKALVSDMLLNKINLPRKGGFKLKEDISQIRLEDYG